MVSVETYLDTTLRCTVLCYTARAQYLAVSMNIKKYSPASLNLVRALPEKLACIGKMKRFAAILDVK